MEIIMHENEFLKKDLDFKSDNYENLMREVKENKNYQ
jgi:hypothetical protein